MADATGKHVKQKVVKKIVIPALTPEEKNFQTLQNFALPFILIIYLGVVLKKYSLADYKNLVTNQYLLLGFKDIEQMRKTVVDNLIASGIWGLCFMYIRKWANPEVRPNTWKFRQDGYFAAFAEFVKGWLKAICANAAAKA